MNAALNLLEALVHLEYDARDRGQILIALRIRSVIRQISEDLDPLF